MNQQTIEPVVDFKKNAAKLFSKVFYAVKKCTARIVVVFGSSNSSKSYSVHQNELLNIMKDERGDTLILRKHGVDIRESSFKLLCVLISQWNLSPYFKTYYSNENRRIVYLPTGRSILFKGLDDAERIKSITGIRRIVMEEASEFAFEDFTELTRRARGYADIQFTLLLNPVSEKHWIKKQLCDPDGAYFGKTETLKFTYKDNKFARPEDIENLEMLKLVSENQYRIYALGEWGVEDKRNKFAWAFSEEKHVKKTEYNPKEVLWLSFDFNVNPMTVTAFQHYEKKIRAIRCIKLENSDTWEICKHIKIHFPDAFFMVTGDATGQNRSTLGKDGVNNYIVICQELGLNLHTQVKVPKQNPDIEDNQTLFNAVLVNYDIEFDPENCQPLIYDMTYVEVDAKKKIIKANRTDQKQQADFLDNARYYFNITFQDIRLLNKK